ncbi:MAG: cytochrome c biogenesis protein CcsA [Rhodoferax sp.]|nr:cytochrome c biogenesis protein CcsA [Rhodoferax sp.]
MILASASAPTISLTLVVAAGYLVPAVVQRHPEKAVRWVLLAAWLLHAVLLAVSLVGDTPRFGFAPALSVTAWLVVAVYGIESRFYPQLRVHWAMCVLAALVVGLAQVFPGAPLHPNASVWLPLHWALGIASYGLFGAAVAHAWFLGRTEDRIRMAADASSGMPLLTIERLTFRLVGAGFVLLTATVVVAFMFTESLYGKGATWRWDHKTVFSLLSWATFAILLLGRARFGWRGRRAVRMLYLGSGLLFLAYVGSRFVLEVILGRVP